MGATLSLCRSISPLVFSRSSSLRRHSGRKNGTILDRAMTRIPFQPFYSGSTARIVRYSNQPTPIILKTRRTILTRRTALLLLTRDEIGCIGYAVRALYYIVSTTQGQADKEKVHRNSNRTMADNKKKEWKNSKAKYRLIEMLTNDEIPLSAEEMSPTTAYNQDAEFAEFDYDLFRERLNDYRKAIRGKKEGAKSSAAALAVDRQLFPIDDMSAFGKRRWEGSDAERLLKVDMDNGLHESTKPEDLCNSRPEYKEFTLKEFRGHIHQETKTKKFHRYLKDKSEKKLAKLK